jgi:hypothetical protein
MHTLTIGATMSGKTRLQQHIAKRLKARGFPVLVCSPMPIGWDAHRIVSSVDELIDLAKRCKSAHLFVDEAGGMIDGNNPDHAWLTTMSRHRGHTAHLITQRHIQVSPTMRDQCGRKYIFRIGRNDAQQLANETTHDLVKIACTLPVGTFLDVTTRECRALKLDMKNGKIEKSPLDKSRNRALTD